MLAKLLAATVNPDIPGGFESHINMIRYLILLKPSEKALEIHPDRQHVQETEKIILESLI